MPVAIRGAGGSRSRAEHRLADAEAAEGLARQPSGEPAPQRRLLGSQNNNMALLADAETTEDLAQQVIGAEFAGDLAEGLLGVTEVLGEQLAGAVAG